MKYTPPASYAGDSRGDKNDDKTEEKGKEGKGKKKFSIAEWRKQHLAEKARAAEQNDAGSESGHGQAQAVPKNDNVAYYVEHPEALDEDALKYLVEHNLVRDITVTLSFGQISDMLHAFLDE